MLTKAIDALTIKLFGIPVWINPFLRYQVEVKYLSDTFTFWGGTPLTFMDGEEFLRVMKESIDAASYHLHEFKPKRIYVGWELYWKVLKTRNLVSDKKALEVK